MFHFWNSTMYPNYVISFNLYQGNLYHSGGLCHLFILLLICLFTYLYAVNKGQNIVLFKYGWTCCSIPAPTSSGIFELCHICKYFMDGRRFSVLVELVCFQSWTLDYTSASFLLLLICWHHTYTRSILVEGYSVWVWYMLFWSCLLGH